MWPAFPTPEYHNPLRLPLDHPSRFPGLPVIGQASLPTTPQTAGVKTAPPGSHDDHSRVQRPLRRKVPQHPLLKQRRLPWPSPCHQRLGPLLAHPQRTGPHNDAYSGLTHVTDHATASTPLRTRPLDHARGHRYQGPRRLPRPDSHRQATVNLSLPRHAVLLFPMAPEQSRRTATMQHCSSAVRCGSAVVCDWPTAWSQSFSVMDFGLENGARDPRPSQTSPARASPV